MLSNIGNGKRRGGGDGAGRAWRGAWPYAALALAVVVLGLTARLAWALNYAGYVTVIATMGQLNPNPIRAGDTATASLSATYEPPANLPAEATPSAQYSWSVSVAYKALYADSYGAPPPNSYTLSISPSQPSPSGGAELSFTPLIAGYWQLTGSCGVKVTDQTANEYWTGSANTGPADLISYTFDITYTGSVAAASGDTTDSGTVVTGKTTDVHAGWPIQLGAELAPSDLASKFTWTISGAGGNGSAAINGYCSSASTGSAVTPGGADDQGVVVPPDASADTKSTFPDPSSPGILKYYYYTEAGSFSVSVVAGGAGSASAKATFALAEYTETMQNSFASGVVSTPLQNGGVGLSLGPPGTSDQILFEQIPGPGGGGFAGSLHFVQIYTENDTWTGNAARGIPNFSVSDAGLDVTYFYGDEAPPPSVVHTGDAPSRGTDNNYIKMVINDSPAMWAMYEPAVPGSIVVPLATQGWQWGGTETLNANTGQWTLTGAVPGGPGQLSPLDPTNEYPVWSHILQPPNPPH